MGEGKGAQLTSHQLPMIDSFDSTHVFLDFNFYLLRKVKQKNLMHGNIFFLLMRLVKKNCPV